MDTILILDPDVEHAANLERALGPSSCRTALCEDAMLPSVAAMAETSSALHSRTNGSTVSLIHGSMADTKFFAVAIYPARAIEFWERPSRDELFEFAKANLDLLLRPGHALGTWFNDFECVHVVDVVVCVPTLDTALHLGLCFNQCSVFDLEHRREIAIPRSHQDSHLYPGGSRDA